MDWNKTREKLKKILNRDPDSEEIEEEMLKNFFEETEEQNN